MPVTWAFNTSDRAETQQVRTGLLGVAVNMTDNGAEIFSHAYEQLGLGTLVGEPTFGAVISTGGVELMGGSYIRLPFRGWYVKETNKNMEHGPAVPDIEVDNAPDYRTAEDAQLKRAVEELLSQIEE